MSCEAWASSTTLDYCTTSQYVQKNCKTACSLCTTPLYKESGGFNKGLFSHLYLETVNTNLTIDSVSDSNCALM